MGSAPSPPPVPSYPQVTGQPNQTAANNYSQAASNYWGSNPGSSESFSITGRNPDGSPIYSINQSYAPGQQQIFEGQQTGQQGAAQAAAGFGSTLPGTFSAPLDLAGDSASLTNQLENPIISNLWNTTMQYQKPQMDAQLQASGIMPGTPAYDQQMKKLTDQQISSFGSVNAQFQPQAFNEALTQKVTAPLGAEQQLLAMSNPQPLMNTAGMGATQQPANVVGAATAQEQAQAQEYQARLQATAANNAGIAGIFGGLAKLPTGGGSSVGGNLISSMFA